MRIRIRSLGFLHDRLQLSHAPGYNLPQHAWNSAGRMACRKMKPSSVSLREVQFRGWYQGGLLPRHFHAPASGVQYLCLCKQWVGTMQAEYWQLQWGLPCMRRSRDTILWPDGSNVSPALWLEDMILKSSCSAICSVRSFMRLTICSTVNDVAVSSSCRIPYQNISIFRTAWQALASSELLLVCYQGTGSYRKLSHRPWERVAAVGLFVFSFGR